MDNILEKAMEEKTSKKPTKQAEEAPALSADFATQIAEALLKFQDLRDAQYREAAMAKDLENEAKLMDKSGAASRNFAQLMEEEIARGEYTDFVYYEAFSKKFGKYFSMNISGYQLNFVVGQATHVPNSLRLHVLNKFNPPKSMNRLPTISVVNENMQTQHNAESMQYASRLTDYVDNLVQTDLAKAKFGF